MMRSMVMPMRINVVRFFVNHLFETERRLLVGVASGPSFGLSVKKVLNTILLVRLI